MPSLEGAHVMSLYSNGELWVFVSDPDFMSTLAFMINVGKSAYGFPLGLRPFVMGSASLYGRLSLASFLFFVVAVLLGPPALGWLLARVLSPNFFSSIVSVVAVHSSAVLLVFVWPLWLAMVPSMVPSISPSVASFCFPVYPQWLLFLACGDCRVEGQTDEVS